MDRSKYLAKLIGPSLLVFGAGLLARPGELLGLFLDIVRNPPLIFVMCLLGLLGGTALILAHNVWAMDWRVIITLLGWWSAIESTVWLIVPHATLQGIVQPLMTTGLVLGYGAFLLLLGTILTYVGYLR